MHSIMQTCAGGCVHEHCIVGGLERVGWLAAPCGIARYVPPHSTIRDHDQDSEERRIRARCRVEIMVSRSVFWWFVVCVCRVGECTVDMSGWVLG